MVAKSISDRSNCTSKLTSLFFVIDESSSAPSGNPYNIPVKTHSVLTDDFRGVGHPTDRVKQRVLEFLKEQLQQ
jgi:hypothetical protein